VRATASRAIVSALQIDLRHILHVEQEFEYGAPIRAGDCVTVERTVADIYAKKGGALEFVVVDSTLHNGDGASLGRARQTILVRNETAWPAAMSATLNSGALGTMVAERTFGPIAREDLRRYAEASGDLNPLHLDPEFARQAGFDDVIVHGMLGMALLGRLITEPWAHRVCVC